MLLDLLGELQDKLKTCNVKLDEDQIQKLREALIFHKGGVLPAKVLKKDLKISYTDTHKLMIFLMTKGYLKSIYKIYCENDIITGASKTYDDPAEIPVEICDRCDRGCALIKNLKVEFKVCD